MVQLREAQALYVRKLIPVTQVLETQARLDTLRADATTASADVVVAKGELIKLVGGESITPLAVKDRISLMSSLSSAEDAERRSRERRGSFGGTVKRTIMIIYMTV